MYNYDYLRELIEEEVNELKKRNPQSEKTKQMIEMLTKGYSKSTYKSSPKINIEDRIKEIEEVEKAGFNPQKRDMIARSIDNDVEESFTNIKYQCFRYQSIEEVECFFKDIDTLIQIEEVIIDLYIKEMRITYINNLNIYRKRILSLLSEKSKVYRIVDNDFYKIDNKRFITDKEFYITDEERTRLLEKFNHYLDEIKIVENTYLAPIFDRTLYESLEKKKDISKKRNIIILISILIIVGIVLGMHNIKLVKIYIMLIATIILTKSRRWRKNQHKKLWDLKETEKLKEQILNDIEMEVEKNIRNKQRRKW